MNTAIGTAQKYFDLSNAKKISEIEILLSNDAAYSSDNTGLYFGKKNILSMMEKFFSSFDNLEWTIHHISDFKENIILIDFTLTAIKGNDKLTRNGLEYIVVNHQNKIQHIEVRNKA